LKAINKEIMRLALPSILANITVPLVGMVDIAVAGHLDTTAAALIGAIAIGSMLFDLLYWNFGFLRIGTGGLTAQAFGREDWQGAAANLGRGVGLALIISALVLLVQWPFTKLVFLFVDCTAEVKELALKYFFIRIWAAPATLSLMSFKGWFIGMQDTRSSMFTDLVVNGVNILCSIFLSMGIPGTGFKGIGFTGIALGTVVAQYSGFLFASLVVLTRYRHVIKGNLSWDVLKAGNMKGFARMNGDLFVRSASLIVIYIGFTAISAGFGDVLLASCSIMMKLLMIFSYFTDGFAFAGEALTGRFIGAKDTPQVKETVKWTFIWSMGIGIFFVGIYVLTGVPLLRLMTSDNVVVAASREFIPWLALMPLVGCPAFTWDGIYVGATASKHLRDSSLWSAIGFFAVWLLLKWLLQPEGSMAVHVLFVAYFTHLVIRSVYQTALYRKAVLDPIS